MQRYALAGLVWTCLPGAVEAQPDANTIPPAPAPAPVIAPAPPAAPAVNAPPGAAASDAPRVTYVFRDRIPAFQDKTAGGVFASTLLIGGAVGGIVESISESDTGAKERAADAFPIPDNLVGANVAKLIAPGLGAAPADAPAQVDEAKLQGSTAQKFAQIAGSARYVVSAQTMLFRSVWASYATWPLDFQHYIVEYMGRVTIYDVKESKQLFEGRCFVFTKRNQPLPTHDEMFANNGAILKTFIGQAADDCVAQLREKNDTFRTLTGAMTPKS